MFFQAYRFAIVTYLLTALAAFLLWQQGWYLGAVMALTLGGGLAMAQPAIEQKRLCLRGTPVILMFAVMVCSASGMVFVADGITAYFAPPIVEVSDCRKMVNVGAEKPCESCVAD